MSSISRRDFLNGAALTIAAGLTPAAQIAAQPARYPPALTGLRGQHAGSFEAAHALARDGTTLSARRRADRGALRPRRGRRRHQRARRRLVLSRAAGPSRAHPRPRQPRRFRRPRQAQRVHARRPPACIGYGGSESIESPGTHYSDGGEGAAARARRRHRALRDARSSASSIRRSACRAACSSTREAFGRDVLVAGEPLRREHRRARALLANAKPLPEFVAAFPVSEDEQGAAARALRRGARSARRQDQSRRSARVLKRTSYRDYLIKICGCSEEAANCFQGRTLGFFGLGMRRGAGRRRARPRLSGLRRARPAGGSSRGRERALHLSFPRRQRLARAAAGALAASRTSRPAHSMDDVVLAPFDYGKLDRARAARSASGSTRPASMSATPATSVARRLCARRACLRRVAAQACGARLLPHDDPAHHAGTAGAAARRRWHRTSRRRSSTPTC